jgi:hypothetical protein
VKLLLDECVGPRASAAIAAVLSLSKQKTEVVHMHDFEGRGAADQSWVIRAAKEGWFVITKDSGKRQDGPPLQLILPAYGVRAAFMHRKLPQRPGIDQVRAILYVYPSLQRAAKADCLRTQIIIQNDGFRAAPWHFGPRELAAFESYRASIRQPALGEQLNLPGTQ